MRQALRHIWRIIAQSRRTKTGCAILAVVLFMAVFSPALTTYDPHDQDLLSSKKPPSSQFWFGTDDLGRDQFSRVVFGSRYAILGVLFVVGLETFIGVQIGLITGFFRGRVDMVITRGLDIMVSIPPLLLAIVIVSAFGYNIYNAMLATAIVYTPMMARVTRSIVMNVCEYNYVKAAQALGYSRMWIMYRHVLPNSLSPVLVQMSADAGYCLLTLAALSFLGLGIQPPTPDWGAMLAASRPHILDAPWMVVFPGVFIAILVLGFTLIGMGLDDTLFGRDTR